MAKLNQECLDRILGGEAAEEYRFACRIVTIFWFNFGIRATLSVTDLDREITTLQSIKYRLSTWAPKSGAITDRLSPARASKDAPIFIVHGSDTLRAESVAHTVTSATGRETIILRDEPNLGRTLIEKFEQHAAEVSYAIIVLTADDQRPPRRRNRHPARGADRTSSSKWDTSLALSAGATLASFSGLASRNPPIWTASCTSPLMTTAHGKPNYFVNYGMPGSMWNFRNKSGASSMAIALAVVAYALRDAGVWADLAG